MLKGTGTPFPTTRIFSLGHAFLPSGWTLSCKASHPSQNYAFVVAVQSVSCVQLFVTPWTAAYQASPSSAISQSLLKFMSIESVMLSNHFILCCPLLSLPSILPSIGVFSNELAPHIRWPKYWSFSISPFNEYSGLISFRTGLISIKIYSHTSS